MKKILVLLIIAAALIFAGEKEADASSYDVAFSDDINHWKGWGTKSQRKQDVITNPNISGGNARISKNGHLKGVNFSYSSTENGIIPPGDLFIDVGADTYWDYVITTSGEGYTAEQPSFDYDFEKKWERVVYKFGPRKFSALKGVNDSYYLMTPDTGGVRNSHPMALSDVGASKSRKIKDYTVTADYGFYWTTWDHDWEAEESTLRFFDFSLDLKGQDFIIGFMPDCANDAIYAKVNNPVPIPTSILLFGSGLIGLVGIRRKAAKAAA